MAIESGPPKLAMTKEERERNLKVLEQAKKLNKQVIRLKKGESYDLKNLLKKEKENAIKKEIAREKRKQRE